MVTPEVNELRETERHTPDRGAPYRAEWSPVASPYRVVVQAVAGSSLVAHPSRISLEERDCAHAGVSSGGSGKRLADPGGWGLVSRMPERTAGHRSLVGPIVGPICSANPAAVSLALGVCDNVECGKRWLGRGGAVTISLAPPCGLPPHRRALPPSSRGVSALPRTSSRVRRCRRTSRGRCRP